MLAAATLVWLIVVGVGLGIVWNHELTPGAPGVPPPQWPAGSHLQLAASQPTLLLFAHPHCPCTRTSISELNALMSQLGGQVTAHVLFVKPERVTADWEDTALWRSAAAIPDVQVQRDEGGHEARRYHVVTSGQTVVYDVHGRLLFSGGITPSRGHVGDNAGRDAILSLLAHGKADRYNTFVFGCALNAPAPPLNK
jgi:hypothetical protein